MSMKGQVVICKVSQNTQGNLSGQKKTENLHVWPNEWATTGLSYLAIQNTLQFSV